MQRYMFERRIPIFELENPERARAMLGHAKRLLYNDAQEKIKELLETGECYSFQVTLVQPTPIDDFEMNTRIVLRLDTQRSNFAPQGVAAPPPVQWNEIMGTAPGRPEDADAFQVGQQYAGQRIAERMAERVDDMARQAFVGGEYGIGEMWPAPRREDTDEGFRRFLYGKQHEAKEFEDVEADFVDADIDAYGYFR